MGQLTIATIYEALASSPLWDRCLLVITYDEHGGFFDHVPPPEAQDEEEAFRRLGFRVHAVVVGPWVNEGVVSETI